MYWPCSFLSIESLVGMCRKPKYGSDLALKNRIIQKVDMRSDGFAIETAWQCKQSAIQIKSE